MREMKVTKSLKAFGFQIPRSKIGNKKYMRYNKMSENENKLVENPKILGAVDLPKIDLKPFNGTKAKISKIEYPEHPQHGVYCKLITNVLDTIEKKEITASKILGLIEIKDEITGEVVGYGWGKESQTFAFLKTMEADTLQDLLGKEVIVRYEVTKKGKDVLSF